MLTKPDRLKILQTIFDHFQQCTQWMPSNPDNTAEYHHKAIALIEVLEVMDCGSAGGYDKDNRPDNWMLYKPYARFVAVLRKHHKDSDIKTNCMATVANLAVYFKLLGELRSRVYNMSKPELALVKSKEDECYQ